MSFIIRSTNGQRTVTKVANKPDRTSVEPTLTEDLVEALRGLTLKFEMKIIDVLHSSDAPAPSAASSQENKGNKPPTFASKKDEILTELKRRLVEEEQQMAQVRGEVEMEPRKGMKSEELKRTVTSERPQNNDLDLKPTFEEPRNASVPVPTIPPSPLVSDNKIQPNVNKLFEPIRSTHLSTFSASGKLVKGTLKIGSTMRTCPVGVSGTPANPIPFISYDNERLAQITSTISQISMDIEALEPVCKVDVGDIVFAKSMDDNSWYRSIVERVSQQNLEVYFFDWGLFESIDLKRVKRLAVLDLGLSKNPACAVKIKILNAPGPLVDKFLECDSSFYIKVESYNDFDETYSISILGE